MKKGWIILYTVLILTVPCLAFGAAGSTSTGSGSAADTGAQGSAAMMPQGMADRYQVSPDPNQPGSYKITPLQPGDTGVSQSGAAGAGSGIYRVQPDASASGAYVATPESGMSGSGAGAMGSGAGSSYPSSGR